MKDFPECRDQAVPGPFAAPSDFVDVYRERTRPYAGLDGAGGEEKGGEAGGEGSDAASAFTFWSMMGGGKRTAQNGWRLDYFVVSRSLLDSVRRCFHLPQVKVLV